MRRRRKRPKRELVPHIKHGRFQRGIERLLERELAELPDHDAAEIERLLAKHADIAR